jgi:hypothetical protein
LPEIVAGMPTLIRSDGADVQWPFGVFAVTVNV